MSGATRLKRLLSPTRVAWIGGGGMEPAIDYMFKNRFDGEAVAVNPKRSAIGGLTCVPGVSALPWIPDLAVLVIPKDGVVETLRDLSEIGCGGAICISSGFSESTDGNDRQLALVKAAGDMPVIGPNCPGIANFLDGNAFMMDNFGVHALDRGVAVISNGGAYLSDLGCADRSQPIAYLIGLGNQAMVSTAQVLDVVLDDPRVSAVNIYFEGLSDVTALSYAAAKAAHKRVPIVAVKGGRSKAGTRAAKSHTASLTGDAAIASALFRRFGWIETETPSEAIETLKMLSFTPIPKGMKTGFATSSGSYAVLGGDMAEKLGLTLEPPSKAAAKRISAALPPYVGPANPLDISDAHGWPEADQLPIYQAFARDPYDLFVQVMCYPPEGGWDVSTWDATTRAMANATPGRPVAFVNTLAEALPGEVRARMIDLGMAPLQGLEDGLRAVAHAARYGMQSDHLSADEMILESDTSSSVSLIRLNEAQAKAKLKEIGCDLPRRWVVTSGQDLPRIPCVSVLKAIVPGIIHKTEIGAVDLELRPEELSSRIQAMTVHLAEQDLHPEGFLIEEMISSSVGELLVGLRRVPGIGVTLTLAVGGTAVELIEDTITLILPATRKDIIMALQRLKLFPTLTGYRGRPSVNLGVVFDAIESLTTYVCNDPRVAELEINPLLLTTNRAVVADAVLTLKG